MADEGTVNDRGKSRRPTPGSLLTDEGIRGGWKADTLDLLKESPLRAQFRPNHEPKKSTHRSRHVRASRR
jgi:hypothetical protein